MSLLLATLLAASASIHHAEDMNAAQFAKLDRAHTVILLVGGILEEHGPYAPISSDGLRNARIADELAKAVVAKPEWSVVIFPMIPLGSGAFDQSMGRGDMAGSFQVRVRTLQAVFMDLADELGRQGFRQVFIVHGHGEPDHNRALDLAGDYFHETYGGTMVHLLGRDGCQPETIPGAPPPELVSAKALADDGDSPHAGLMEMARSAYLRPDLVAQDLTQAQTITGKGFPSWHQAAQRKDWPGYIGAPRYATIALGEWEMKREIKGCTDLALRLLGGFDEKTVGRYADRMKAIPPIQKALDGIRKEEDDRGKRQDAFLKRHGEVRP